MPIPKDILAVERPVNTVVYAYGKNKDKYGVKKRIGCQYRNGKNYPVNGPTVGHIIDGKYVPVEMETAQPVSSSLVDLKDWADASLCYELASDLMDELLPQYNRKDASILLCIAILRVCHPGIADCELKEAYEQSFLSELMPNLPLSRNSVSTFINDVGKACSRIISFMRNRTQKVKADHHLLVDGTLKTSDSKVNTLSEFSRKARIKNSRDLSVLYAFDLEAQEPVCSQCFPGNMLDITAYDDFITTNGITRGILVGDKGFPEKSIEEILKAHPDLHYLNPLKRSSLLAKNHHMYSYEGTLDCNESYLDQNTLIQYRKAKVENRNKWLYSFRDSVRASAEEKDWLKRHRGNEYDEEQFRKKQETFGTIVLESDQDLTPLQAWRACSCRWEIEIVMRYYKSALEFGTTRVHNDYSVIGSEFIDFLSTTITFKLLKHFRETGVLDHYSYGQVMKILRKGKKVKVEEEWKLVKMNPSQIEVLMSAGLLPKPEEAPKRKRGRPRKRPL